MLKYLQRIGKAIMLPIAALPIAGFSWPALINLPYY